MQGGFAGAVVAGAEKWDEGKATGGEHQLGLGLLGLKEWQEGLGEVDVGEVVCGEFLVDGVEVDGGGVFEVEATLNAGVHDNGVECWVGFGDARRCVLVCSLGRQE